MRILFIHILRNRKAVFAFEKSNGTLQSFSLVRTVFFYGLQNPPSAGFFCETTRTTCGFLIICDFSMKTEACFDMIILKMKNTVYTIFI